MERKVKYDYDFKLRCVEEVLKRHRSVNSIAKESGVDKVFGILMLMQKLLAMAIAKSKI